MKQHLAFSAGLLIAIASHAEIPMLDNVCPGNFEVQAKPGGPVYINRK